MAEENVDLMWVNFEGGETNYATIPHGCTHEQQTYVGHEWVVRKSNSSEEITRFQGQPQTIQMTIQSQGQKLPDLEDSDPASEHNEDMVSEGNASDDEKMKSVQQMIKRKIGEKTMKGVSNDQLSKFAEAKAFVDEIIAKGEPWTDPDFPPEFSSLAGPGCSQQQFDKVANIEWKRASEMTEGLAVFKDGIEPNDIQQGALGTCYYLCTLASMAEVPDRVYDRFITREVNSAGIYLVTLFINGVETPVILDDWLPSMYGQPAFAKTSGGELWVSLMEKAWAKVHGCYTIAEIGQPLTASLHLQGVPGFMMTHTDYLGQPEEEDEFWRTLMHADKRNYANMVCSHGSGEHKNDNGIISGHAYSVISVHEVQSNGQTVRLLKIRNPWGHGEWKGDWGDESPLWTDDLRQQVGCDVKDEGIFLMPLGDFLQQFHSTSCCVENDMSKYIHNLAKTDFTNRNRGYYTFEIPEDINCEESVFAISVYQQGDRLRKYRQKDENKFEHSSFIISMMKRGTWVKGACAKWPQFVNALIVDEGVLTAGRYHVMVDPIWDPETTDKDSDYKKVVLDVYCNQDIDLRIADQKVLQHFNKAIMTKARENEGAREFYMAQNAGLEKLYRVVQGKELDCGLIYMYFKNETDFNLKQVLKLTLDGMEVFKKPELTKNDDGSYNVEEKMHKGEDDLIILRRNAPGAYRYNYQMQINTF